MDPAYFLQVKNSRLTKNILVTHIVVGAANNFQLSFINTSPKCEMCVTANAEPSAIEAFLSPMEAAKPEWTIPLKNNSSPIGLNVIPVRAIMEKSMALSC